MTKLGAVFWLGLVVASGFTTFKVKYAVQDIEDELMRVRKHTVAEQQEIRVLNAEWTYLNQPERLADLNRRFLQLAPISARQLQARIEDFPLRPPPPPPAPEPDLVIAANPQPAAPSPSQSAADALASLVTQVATTEPPATAPSAAAVAPAAPAVATAAPSVAAAAPARRPAAIAAAALLGGSAQAAPVHLAKAAPASLDALIAHIAETR